MLALSPKDLELIDSLVSFGVFDDIDGFRIDRKSGIVLVCCADGDQFHDLYEHECRFQLNQRDTPRIHPLCRNGGPLAYDEGTPVNRFPDSYKEYRLEVGDSISMKTMPTIVMKGHGPCGAAHHYSISLIRQLEMQMRVKAALRKMYPHVDIASHFHVDYKGWNGKQKKTYYFGREQWTEWYALRSKHFLAFA